MSKKLMSCFKSMDIFSKMFNFNIRGEAKLTTSLGGIVTLAMFVFLLIITCYFGKDIVEKQHPNFLSNEDVLPRPPLIQPWKKLPEKTDMFLAFRFSSGKYNSEDIDPRFFEHVYQQKILETDTSTQIQTKLNKDPVSIQKCKESDIEDINVFNEKKLSNYYCIPFQKYDWFGGDDFVSPNITRHYFHEFFIKPCSLDTQERKNITCATSNELNRFIEDTVFYIEIIYQSNLIDSANFDQPYKKTFVYYQEKLDYQKYNSTQSAYNFHIFYRNCNITDDTGIIFEEDYSKQYLELDYYQQLDQSQSSNFDEYGGYIFKGVLKSSQKSKKYSRRYIKIPEVISKVGGFMSLLAFAIQIIFDIYLDNYFSVSLYQQLYELHVEKDYDRKDIDNDIQLAAKSINFSNDMQNVEKSNIISNLNISGNQEKCCNNSNTNLTAAENKLTNENKLFNLDIKETSKNERFTSLLIDDRLNKEIVEITKRERFSFVYCFCREKSKILSKDYRKLKYELFSLLERDLDNRKDIVSLFKTLDKLNLFQRLVLNENQNFMLNNTGLKVITNKLAKEKDFVDLNKESYEKSKSDLIVYFKDKMLKEEFSSIDFSLFKLLRKDLKDDVVTILKLI